MSAEAEAPEKMITLQSKDGWQFQVEEDIAIQSITIKNIIEDCDAERGLPLPVRGEILKKVIDYWKLRVLWDDWLQDEDASHLEDTLKRLDDDFAKSKNRDELFEILIAASFLNSRSLLDRLAQEVADRTKDMSVEEAREYLGIKNDCTPEEEQKLQAENPWAFE